MFMLYRIALAPARKSFRPGRLFTHKNHDFGAIFCTVRPGRIGIQKFSICQQRKETEYPEKNFFMVTRKITRPATNSTLICCRHQDSNPGHTLVGGQCCHHCTTPPHPCSVPVMCQFERQSIYAFFCLVSFFTFPFRCQNLNSSSCKLSVITSITFRSIYLWTSEVS